MKSIALIQVSSLGAGYEALQIASLRSKIEVLEFIPMGKESQILLEGSYEELDSYRRVLRTADLEKSVILREPDARLLKSYYHQESAKPLDYILILESNFAGYLLETAGKLLKQGLEVMDFRQPRFSGSMASLVMTGKDLSKLEDLVKQSESSKVKVSFVESPSDKMKAYFDVSPKS